MSIRFEGINISSKNPADTFEFYKGLGLKVAEAVEDPDNEWYGASFKLGESGGGDCLLWIWRTHDDVPPRNLIVLKCDDIDETYKELKMKGYAVDEPVMQFWGGKEMKLSDPDGNDILFL